MSTASTPGAGETVGDAFSAVARAVERQVGLGLREGSPRVAAASRGAAWPSLVRQGPLSPAWDGFVESLLVHETYFFRHPRQFAFIESDVLPALRDDARRAGRAGVAAWCASCSTGEEAWSLALASGCDGGARAPAVRIEASDLSEAALATARRAVYGRQAALGSFRMGAAASGWSRMGDGAGPWSPSPALRRCVRFGKRNILEPVDDGPFDLLLCRNTLIYMTAAARRLALGRLASALRPGGYLALGTAETPEGDPRFSPVGPPAAMMFRREPASPRAGA